MLNISLRRTQLELQGHRRWLATFAAGYWGFGARLRPCLIPRQHTERRHYITPKHIKRRAVKQQKALGEVADQEIAEAAFKQTIRKACESCDVEALHNIVETSSSLKSLNHEQTWRLAQSLHQGYRHRNTLSKSRITKPSSAQNTIYYAFAGKLVELIRKGELEPDARAHLHLISFFKESGARDAGVEFWSWLEGQDDRYVSDDVYGAAIELLVVHGAPLVEMEALFQKALQRFPGTFNAYHLSSNAIVADREQIINIRGISMVLLQGILTARLMHGDSKNAYLALDTAMRLLPAQTPPRFITLFLDERPVVEAYTVFAMACRAGIKLPYEAVRRFLAALRLKSSLSFPQQHMQALRQMLSCVYMYLGSSDYISRNVVSELVITMAQILRLKGAAALEVKEKRALVTDIMELIRKALAIAARFGVSPSISAFNSIIVNLAGFGQTKSVIALALKDAQALGLQANEVTHRSVMIAAGKLNDADLVARSWNDLVSERLLSGQKIEPTDYHLLVTAAKTSGATEFAEQACEAMASHGILEEAREGVLNHLRTEFVRGKGHEEPALDIGDLRRQFENLRADLDVMAERTMDKSVAQDFSQQDLPLTLAPIPNDINLPEAESRRLYDEVTTDPTLPPQPPPAQVLPPAVSPTGIPYGRLRYENWTHINHLLALAERTDAIYSAAVDKAIAKGVRVPSREQALAASDLAVQDVGLSTVHPGKGKKDERLGKGETERRRKEILKLRGIVMPSASAPEG
ncbi:hypothetical protein Tdes44962_MAKER01805 [Teratosphaeria destructans]|uniref:Pentatricopeptide repeat protein n=1 Tax=Teratosphaeria destructans TaxID=418781 RepID=A0A9W7SX77_9PEZI|nr:hypothetical protein Tdes44962_MAKER01805 [Teratosphaeria destructans]